MVIEPALAVLTTKPVVEVVHESTIAATTHRAARKEDMAKKIRGRSFLRTDKEARSSAFSAAAVRELGCGWLEQVSEGGESWARLARAKKEYEQKHRKG